MKMHSSISWRWYVDNTTRNTYIYVVLEYLIRKWCGEWLWTLDYLSHICNVYSYIAWLFDDKHMNMMYMHCPLKMKCSNSFFKENRKILYFFNDESCAIEVRRTFSNTIIWNQSLYSILIIDLTLSQMHQNTHTHTQTHTNTLTIYFSF